MAIAKLFIHHLSCLYETVIPWQTFSGISWVFCGILSAPIAKNFQYRSFFPLLVCILSARFFGMSFNHLVDWKIDALNPRTSHRCLPRKALKPSSMALYSLFFLSVFLFSCSFFKPLEAILGAVLAVVILVYSFLKRVTPLSHFCLGLLYAMLPIVGSLWVDGSVSCTTFYIAVTAFCTVSGSDIVYALQDERFDKKISLKSIPVSYGFKRSVEIASMIHVIGIASMFFSFYFAHLHSFFYILWAIGSFYILSTWNRVLTGKIQDYGKIFKRLLFLFPAILVCAFAAEAVLCELL